MLSNDYNYNVGWQCPICKHVYSPTVTQCPYCGDRETVDSDKIAVEKNGDTWTIHNYKPYTVTLRADGTVDPPCTVTTARTKDPASPLKEKVVKALEICKRLNYNPNRNDCDGCPYYDEDRGTCDTMGDILRDALIVINDE